MTCSSTRIVHCLLHRPQHEASTLVNHKNMARITQQQPVAESQRGGIQRRRRSRIDDTDKNASLSANVDRASAFLQHFHASTSRSLDIIHEDGDSSPPDSNDDQESCSWRSAPIGGALATISRRNTKTIHKAQTCSCLSVLDHPSVFESGPVRRSDGLAAREEDESHTPDEWGFYSLSEYPQEDEIQRHPVEMSQHRATTIMRLEKYSSSAAHLTRL